MFFSVTCVRGDKKTKEIYSQQMIPLHSSLDIHPGLRNDLNLSSRAKTKCFRLVQLAAKLSSEIIVRELLKGASI